MSCDYDNGSADTFLSDLEERFGGKITYRAFASFYGDSNGEIKDHGVFLYVINGVFHFQDFEIHKSVLGIPVKSKEQYVKFESQFEASQVRGIRTVSRKKAQSFCCGNLEHDRLKTAGLPTRVFSETVQEFAMEDGSYLYFRFMDNEVEKMIMQDRAH